MTLLDVWPPFILSVLALVFVVLIGGMMLLCTLSYLLKKELMHSVLPFCCHIKLRVCDIVMILSMKAFASNF